LARRENSGKFPVSYLIAWKPSDLEQAYSEKKRLFSQISPQTFFAEEYFSISIFICSCSERVNAFFCGAAA
jgi:hypothetical protein